MMLIVNLTNAKAHLSKILDKVEAGQEVTITTSRTSKISCGHAQTKSSLLRIGPGVAKRRILNLQSKEMYHFDVSF